MMYVSAWGEPTIGLYRTWLLLAIEGVCKLKPRDKEHSKIFHAANDVI